MAKKKAATRRAKPAVKRRPSKALNRQTPHPQSLALVVRDPNGLMPQQPAISVSRQIGQGIALLGELGLVEMKFTPEEERVMNESVDETRVRMKPGKKGPPIPFLPHIEYTRWYNRAFGRGGWNMVPIDLPKMTNKTVSRDYVLFVHGKPVAFATGEQDYFETNERQTYGDALEATMSSALRRAAKHLGMGLELWDKDWLDRFIRKHGHRSKPEDGQEPRHQEEERPKATARTGDEHALITLPQRQRLFTIGKTAGRTKGEITTWIKHYLGVTDSGQITRKDYDRICGLVEKPGALPRKEKVHEPEVLPPMTDEDIRFDFGENRR